MSYYSSHPSVYGMPASSRAIAAVTADSSRHRFIVGTCALGGLPSTAAGVESSAAAPTAGGGAAPGDKGAPPAGRKRQPNEVHLIELNEELNEVECVQIWPHAAGTEWMGYVRYITFIRLQMEA